MKLIKQRYTTIFCWNNVWRYKNSNKRSKVEEHPVQYDEQFIINTDIGLYPDPLIPPGKTQLNNDIYGVLSNNETKSNNSHVSTRQKYDP